VLFAVLVTGLIAATACGGNDKSGGSSQNNGPAATAAALSAPPKVSIEQVVFSTARLAQNATEPDSSKLATTFTTNSVEAKPRPTVVGLVKLADAGPGMRTAWLGVSIKYKGQTFERPPMVARAGGWQQFPLFSESSDNPPGGDYELVLTPLTGGDAKSGKFTITDTATSPAKPKLDEALTVANYLGETRDKPNLKPSSFTETTVFKTTDFITVVFSMADPQPAAWATATWKYQGKQIGAVRASANVIQGSVRGFILTEPRRPGQYEVTIAIPETGESRTLKFTIAPPEGVQSKFDQVGLVKLPAKGVQPSVDAFASSFDAFDKIAVASQVNPPPETKTPNLVHMAATYEGKQVFLGADTNLASPWLVTGFFVPPPYPAGHYEVTLTNSASGESRVLRYTVTTEGSTPTPAATVTATKTP
jgi:hypothetical protein